MRRIRRGDAPASRQLVREIEAAAKPFTSAADLNPLMEAIGDSRIVLLGEASHGTHEYYTWRATISRRLILEKGFRFLAVEGDWPDCYQINRYIQRLADAGESAHAVLRAFSRWPTWMWANAEIEALVEWLHRHNLGRPSDDRVGFFGLDVYSLWDSLNHVLVHLRGRGEDIWPAARRAFRCFEPYSEDFQNYARDTRWFNTSCEDEAIELLTALRSKAMSGGDTTDAGFNAEQNALVVQNAERYYRTMVRGGPDSWNIRDHHMVETLERLLEFHGERSKAIVWEHNTHVGDARFTDMVDVGMENVGEILRRRHASEGVFIVGFSGYEGSVIAGQQWEAPMEIMPVPPARSGSWEDVLREASAEDILLLFDSQNFSGELLKPRGHRAIGVVYNPTAESGNYVPTILSKRYDALIALNQTTALRPLHDIVPRHEGEVPETFPSGA
jgi:erythromycin esterase